VIAIQQNLIATAGADQTMTSEFFEARFISVRT
jgi:hypothetical protein